MSFKALCLCLVALFWSMFMIKKYDDRQTKNKLIKAHEIGFIKGANAVIIAVESDVENPDELILEQKIRIIFRTINF